MLHYYYLYTTSTFWKTKKVLFGKGKGKKPQIVFMSSPGHASLTVSTTLFEGDVTPPRRIRLIKKRTIKSTDPMKTTSIIIMDDRH